MNTSRSSAVSAKKPPAAPQRVERVQPVGDVIPFGQGWYQAVALLNSLLAGCAFLCHTSSDRLTSRVLDHWCRPPDTYGNLSADEWKHMAIPRHEDGTYSQCTRRDPPDAGEFSQIVSCVSWDFDRKDSGELIVSEWLLVCDQRWLLDAGFFIYSTISLLWLPVLGTAADRVGRKIVVVLSVPALLFTGFASLVTGSFQSFVALRVVVSGTTAALLVTLIVVLYEVTVPAQRTGSCYTALALMHISAALAMTAARTIRLGWRYIYLVPMLPTSLHVVMFLTVDESYSWLMTTWRTKVAERVALFAAWMNGVSADECVTALTKTVQGMAQVIEGDATGKSPRESIFSPELRQRSLLFCFIWCVVHYCYSQITRAGSLPLNKTTVVAAALSMAPAHIACYAAVCRFGTKRLAIVAMLLLSASSTFMAAAYNSSPNTALVHAMTAVLRVMASVVSSLCICLPIEAYPIRTRCMGVSFAFAVGWAIGNGSELALRHTPIQRTDVSLVSMSLLTVVAAMAVNNLPLPGFGDDDSTSTFSRRASMASKDDIRRSFMESLVPLPKRPIMTRKKSARNIDCLPEQFSLRLSRMSLHSDSE
ncbi:solute carrier family 22 member 7-like [Amblyomma americanum]